MFCMAGLPLSVAAVQIKGSKDQKINKKGNGQLDILHGQLIPLLLFYVHLLLDTARGRKGYAAQSIGVLTSKPDGLFTRLRGADGRSSGDVDIIRIYKLERHYVMCFIIKTVYE